MHHHLQKYNAKKIQFYLITPDNDNIWLYTVNNISSEMKSLSMVLVQTATLHSLSSKCLQTLTVNTGHHYMNTNHLSNKCPIR